MFILVGTNHKYSPIEIREKVSFPKNKLREALMSLISDKRIKAVAILSTCNRVELYASVPDKESGFRALKEFIADYHHKDLREIEPYFYTYIGQNAIQHLFNVSCGLDSQIVGESQILGQVKFAWEQAKIVEATDTLLDMIFEKAIRTSLKVRRETGISRSSISLGDAVIGLIKTRYSCLKDKNILIIGVGKISELVIRYLKEEEAHTIFISNRTYEKAARLARHINAEVVRFDSLKEKLKETDIVISTTSSPHLILKKNDILEASCRKLSTLTHQPLLIIDLAVPRDVDPDVKYISGVSLFDLDDLNFVIRDNLCNRIEDIPSALQVIQKEARNTCLIENLSLEPEPALLP